MTLLSLWSRCSYALCSRMDKRAPLNYLTLICINSIRKFRNTTGLETTTRRELLLPSASKSASVSIRIELNPDVSTTLNSSYKTLSRHSIYVAWHGNIGWERFSSVHIVIRVTVHPQASALARELPPSLRGNQPYHHVAVIRCQ